MLPSKGTGLTSPSLNPGPLLNYTGPFAVYFLLTVPIALFHMYQIAFQTYV